MIKKGKVGYGLGKADEVMDAKRKASDEARKNMFKIPLREGRTLHHDIVGKFCSGKVVMRAHLLVQELLQVVQQGLFLKF